jgi:ubiquinone/menaquinone biosynthesis C-methylase UbiE
MQAPIYDTIGQSYIKTRRPDPRIVDALVSHLSLPEGSIIADIGAGIGSYTNALADRGFILHAVEPAAVMRQQAAAHPNVYWHEGTAEDIPLTDAAVQGVISTLAIHHFPNLGQALREMNRVAKAGPLVYLTFDYRQIDRLWLGDYFPMLWEDAVQSLPPLDDIASEIEANTEKTVEITPFLLPPDLADMFLAAGWRRPEVYLDPAVRAGISSFQIADPSEVEQGLERLRRDLEDERWDERYGWLRSVHEIDAGYRFLRAFRA